MSPDQNLTFSLRRKLPGSPSYYSAALTALRRFARADSLSPAQLTPALIGRFAASLARAGKSPNTISSYLRALRAIHSADLRAGLPPSPEAPFARLPRVDSLPPAAPAKAPAKPRADRPRWRALLNSHFPSREDILLADPLLATVPHFIPRATIMRRTPAGLKPAPDPTLARLLFFRATTADTAALQRRLDRRATVIFNRDGASRTFAAIPDRQMHMFQLAISGGIEDITDIPADTRHFRAAQRVRVVGHPLFDGLEGTVSADASASAAAVTIAISGLNKLLLTPRLPKQFLLPL